VLYGFLPLSCSPNPGWPREAYDAWQFSNVNLAPLLGYRDSSREAWLGPSKKSSNAGNYVITRKGRLIVGNLSSH